MYSRLAANILSISTLLKTHLKQLGPDVAEHPALFLRREGSGLPLPVILTGFLTSAVFGVLAIKLVQWVVKGNKLKYFGWYTLALGAVMLTVGVIDNFAGHPIQQFFIGK